jgi:DNA-directed RNA polymerase specialized sigma subunit
MFKEVCMTTKMTLKQRVKRDEKIVRLYTEKNKSTRQIAEIIGISKSRVHEIIQLAGF